MHNAFYLLPRPRPSPYHKRWGPMTAGIKPDFLATLRAAIVLFSDGNTELISCSKPQSGTPLAL